MRISTIECQSLRQKNSCIVLSMITQIETLQTSSKPSWKKCEHFFCKTVCLTWKVNFVGALKLKLKLLRKLLKICKNGRRSTSRQCYSDTNSEFSNWMESTEYSVFYSYHLGKIVFYENYDDWEALLVKFPAPWIFW